MQAITWFSVEDWQEELITHAFPDAQLIHEPFGTAHGPSETRILVIRPRGAERITNEQLQHYPQLQHLLTLSSGTDNLCVDRPGVTLHHLQDYSSTSVAEHAFALLLALAHGLHDPTRRPIELAGKRLGVIGAGSIGRALIRLARAARMDCLAYDVQHGTADGFRYAELDDVLACDAISLHVPLTPQTTLLLDRQRLSRLRDGTIIINTARGGLIDTNALLDELRTGRLLAGLDVLAVDGREDAWTTPQATALRALPNVLLTEHRGGDTLAARRRATEQAITILTRLRTSGGRI